MRHRNFREKKFHNCELKGNKELAQLDSSYREAKITLRSLLYLRGNEYT